MRVILPDNIPVTNIWFVEYARFIDAVPLQRTRGQQTRVTGEILWKVDNPKQGGRYAITWE